MALYLPDAIVLIDALRKTSKEHESCRRPVTVTVVNIFKASRVRRGRLP